MSWGFGRRSRARQADQTAPAAVAQWQIDAATPTVREVVTVLLRQLGDTRDQVADSLRAAKITGTPSSPCTCPVARYVFRSLNCRYVSVSPNTVFVRLRGEAVGDHHRDTLTVMVTPAVRDFIEAFDAYAAYGGLSPYVDLMASDKRLS